MLEKFNAWVIKKDSRYYTVQAICYLLIVTGLIIFAVSIGSIFA